MMRYTPVFGCENVEGYVKGGFHPVEIGDTFSDGRYVIAHKLGHGGFATVWLARDTKMNRYIALKVVAAEVSENSKELRIHKRLQMQGPDVYQRTSIIAMLDHFQVEGPNGTHLVLVLEIAGPSLRTLLEDVKFRPDIARQAARQLLKSLIELHKIGVAYGDLSTGNILLGLNSSIDEWNTEKLYNTFGKPDPIEMRIGPDGDELDHHAPKHVYQAIELKRFEIGLLNPDLKFIDFGEAHFQEIAPNHRQEAKINQDQRSDQEATEGQSSQTDGEITDDVLAYNCSYSAPETVFWQDKPDQRSDIWALACIWFEIRARKQLFQEGLGGEIGIQNQMIDTIGPLPKPWAKRRAAQWQTALEVEDVEGQSAVARTSKAWSGVKSLVLRGIFRMFRPFMKVEVDAEPLHVRIKLIGKWSKWCRMSIAEREEAIKKFHSQFGPGETPYLAWEEEMQADTGPPPPGPLSVEEARDFENILRLMLKFSPEERVKLESLLDHPWLRKDYADDTSGPVMERYSEGVILEIHHPNGKVEKLS